MEKYFYKGIKATCLYQEGTPYQDKSAYEDLYEKIKERTKRINPYGLFQCPKEGFEVQEADESQRVDSFFIQNLHLVYLFVYVRGPKDENRNNYVLSRIIKLESSSDSFIPFLDMDFIHYCLYRYQNHSFNYKTGEDLDINNERMFLFYSPETESYMFSLSYTEEYLYNTFTISLKKDASLPKPVLYGTVMERSIHDASKFPKGFRFDLLSDRITGKYEVDKEERDFTYFQKNPLYLYDRSNNTHQNPHSFWFNFYKSFGDFNIFDLKKIVKKKAYEVHPLDDSSFDKINDDPILQRLLYRHDTYPDGYLRYIGYSFFSKGDELEDSKIVTNYDKSTKEHIPALSVFELRICLDDECEDPSLVSTPYENPYALGDLWNLKLGSDMILYHPILKEAALLDGWEKKVYLFKCGS